MFLKSLFSKKGNESFNFPLQLGISGTFDSSFAWIIVFLVYRYNLFLDSHF